MCGYVFLTYVVSIAVLAGQFYASLYNMKYEHVLCC